MVTTSSLVYWSLAWLLVLLAVASGLRGWQLARLGRLGEHRRAMLRTLRLFGVFLASYVLKALVLGRESLDTWPRSSVVTLRVHESIVLLMLITGLAAWGLSRRVDLARGRRQEGRMAFLHRLCGRTALVAALGTLITASMVLAAMFRLARI
jgi:uncharacterized membrane protein YozB (DUF420 family)